MKSIRTVFAVHNHQPIGNFEKVFDEAYARSYRPFLDVLEKHPSVKFSQHWTGTLLEWLVRNHPELIKRMRAMVKRGQLELLTGSYYEAILAIIPEEDRIGQIKKLTAFIEEVFNFTPRGMWLAERVCEQQLVASLVKAGVEFVIVDDTHFKHAGLHDDQLLGYYVTEDQGHSLNIMPIDKTLRYTIPFRALEETVHYVQQVASEDGNRVIIHADDGEKFGVWPRTYESVYEHSWLESFCTMLESNDAWVHTVHFSDVLDSTPPQGRIYLPAASYSEMLKWVLNPTSFLQLERFEKQLKDAGLYDENSLFVRGGFWRNFLAKYPESNHMHKKMLRVARRARAARLGGSRAREIFDHIWAGQCNDPYWHGVFGGLYLPNLRFPVYRNLLEAEAKLDTIQKLPPIRVEETDFDCDGAKEVLVETDEMNLYVKPSTGGCLVEVDYKPLAFNLLDILSRREEGYHRRLMAVGVLGDQRGINEGVLMKEKGLEKHLHFDWYRHASLIDHFLGEGTTLDEFSQCKYLEVGDFVGEPYASAVKKSREGVEVTLVRHGALWFDGRPHNISVKKILWYKPGTSRFSASYTIVNRELQPVDIRFGVELVVGLMAGDAHDRYYDIEGRPLENNRLKYPGEETEVKTWRLVDEWLGLEAAFTLNRAAMLWRFPIETVSLSEQGFEKVYQGSVVMPHWRVRLEKEFSVEIVQSLKKLK